jgi:hypothetical protein
LALHKSHAKRETRGALQRAIRKYGFESIKVEVLATGENWETMCNMEKAAITEFDSLSPNGYNLTVGGEGTLGVKMTPDQVQRAITSRGCRKGIAPRPAGWKHSEDARVKIAEAGRGRIFSDERKSKIGVSKIGNTYSVGIPCSQEKRDKISAAQKGRVFSDEHRAKLKAAALNRRASK